MVLHIRAVSLPECGRRELKLHMNCDAGAYTIGKLEILDVPPLQRILDGRIKLHYGLVTTTKGSMKSEDC